LKSLFDPVESAQAKTEGMALAERNKQGVLILARQLACVIARSKESRECHADEVGKAMQEKGINPNELGAAAGSIFKGDAWEFTGKRVRSERVSNHSRELKVWRLKGG
jgi:hypothetical protein